ARHQLAQAQGSGGSVGARQQSLPAVRDHHPDRGEAMPELHVAAQCGLTNDRVPSWNPSHSTLPTRGGSGMSMYEEILSQLGGSGVAEIGRQTGLAPADASRAVAG